MFVIGYLVIAIYHLVNKSYSYDVSGESTLQTREIEQTEHVHISFYDTVHQMSRKLLSPLWRLKNQLYCEGHGLFANVVTSRE